MSCQGDTYSYVRSRGLAQWRLEQLDYVVENSHSKSSDVMDLTRYTLYFATLHEEDKNLSGGVGATGSEDPPLDSGFSGADPGHLGVQIRGGSGSATAQAISELQADMQEMKQILMSLQRSASSRRVVKKTQ